MKCSLVKIVPLGTGSPSVGAVAVDSGISVPEAVTDPQGTNSVPSSCLGIEKVILCDHPDVSKTDPSLFTNRSFAL